MKKILLILVVCIFAKSALAQTDVAADTTAIGLGATSSSSNYKFIYQNRLTPHYGLGWFSDADQAGAPTAYLSGYGGIKLFTRGTPRLYIQWMGNIGIGTTTPQTLLDVNGIGSFKQNLLIKSNLTNSAELLLYKQNGNYYDIVSNNNQFQIYNSEHNGAVLTADANDRIGIGTTTPDEKLSVVGTIHATRVKVNTGGRIMYSSRHTICSRSRQSKHTSTRTTIFPMSRPSRK